MARSVYYDTFSLNSWIAYVILTAPINVMELFLSDPVFIGTVSDPTNFPLLLITSQFPIILYAGIASIERHRPLVDQSDNALPSDFN